MPDTNRSGVESAASREERDLDQLGGLVAAAARAARLPLDCRWRHVGSAHDLHGGGGAQDRGSSTWPRSSSTQNGIRATGIARIISHAGVARATFFHHFPAKSDFASSS
ncbi:MAG: helix-turn-helix domain-containing protein [Gaiellaceae bacterium]